MASSEVVFDLSSITSSSFPVSSTVATSTNPFCDNNNNHTESKDSDLGGVGGGGGEQQQSPVVQIEHLPLEGVVLPHVKKMLDDPFNNGTELLIDDDNDEDDHHGALEDDNSALAGHEQDCKICQNKLQSPRVLSCLHVFCEHCLDKLLMSDGAGDAKMPQTKLECPVCKELTKIGPKGAASLHSDYVLTNILDLSTIELAMLACTSCKGKENAISRCNDCANILCASCDNAHQYMRCFENHKVVKLDELLKSPEKVAIHKPLFCMAHPTENLKYYCFSCQIPVCNECLIADHKGAEHNYEIISDAEQCMRTEMESLMKEAKLKVNYCDDAAQQLDTALTELQSQHDTARDLIEESFQSFKAVLEKSRDNALKELEKLHSERELKIMDMMHNVEKSIDQIGNASKFTTRVLDNCNAPELLSLKKVICGQFLNLITKIPKADVNYSLEFVSKFEKFEVLASDTFGKFKTEASLVGNKDTTPPPIMINNHQINSNVGGAILGSGSSTSGTPGINGIGIGGPNFGGFSNGSSQGGAMTGSVSASSPISLPTSMQSSFDGDISALGATSQSSTASNPANSTTQFPLLNGNLDQIVSGPGVVPTTVSSSGPSVDGSQPSPATIPGLTSIAEYNIQQLANLVEQTNVASGPAPELSDAIIPTSTNPTSPQPQFTLADLLSGDQNALNNLQAWTKLGLNNPPASLLSRGPSPGVDNLLMHEFSALSANGDDLLMTNFNSNSSQSQNSLGMPGRTKSTPMQIRCKFGSLGPSKSQFNSPHGFCLGVDEEIIVADTNNHRIEVFEKSGNFKFQFGVPGKDEGQLWYPRKVAVMRPSYKFVVCDRGNERSRMQIFNKAGHFMKKIAIRYIDIVAGLAVTNQGHIVAVDSVSPTVFIISEEGVLLHWFDCSDYMREPSDIAISGNDFYVCDFKGHCVVVFSDTGTFKYRIGNEKITCFPNGIDISDAGDILIGDSHGNRFHVACFSREGVLQSEYECPYVKVSRCCGLKITSEGFVVTLAKNNHHVLVLNTLYIQ